MPVVAGIMFTSVSCILTNNYYYIPEWADSLITVFYKAGSLCVELGVYLGMGYTAYGILFKRKGLFLTVPLTLVTVFAGEMLLYLTRLAFFGSNTVVDILAEYYSVDVVNMLTLAVKYAAFALIACAALAATVLFDKKPAFERPYIVPKGAVQISCVVLFGLIISGSLVSFFAYGEYYAENIVAVVYTCLTNIAGYFTAVLGAYAAKRTS